MPDGAMPHAPCPMPPCPLLHAVHQLYAHRPSTSDALAAAAAAETASSSSGGGGGSIRGGGGGGLEPATRTLIERVKLRREKVRSREAVRGRGAHTGGGGGAHTERPHGITAVGPLFGGLGTRFQIQNSPTHMAHSPQAQWTMSSLPPFCLHTS